MSFLLFYRSNSKSSKINENNKSSLNEAEELNFQDEELQDIPESIIQPIKCPLSIGKN